ncbi:MAG: alpha/beta hydrolase [Candidatus Magasanikbacteria bacterium]
MKKKHLVIIPGWGGSHETWQDFVEIAQTEFDVMVIDLPCFGSEPCPSTVWGVVEYAEFVKSRIENIQCDLLLGHSFGGQIAAYLVLKNPNVCTKLILSGAAIYRPKKWVRRGIFFIIAKFGKVIFRFPHIEKFDAWARKVLYRVADSPDYSETVEIKRDIFKKIIREDISGSLSSLKKETLVIWGEKDSYVPLRFGKKIAKEIKDSKMEIIQDGKHGLHIQKSKELLEIIKNFS